VFALNNYTKKQSQILTVLIFGSTPININDAVEVSMSTQNSRELENLVTKLELSRDTWYSKYLDLLNKYEKPKIGTPEWLAITEVKYGGISKNVSRNKVSKHDPRTEEQLKTGGMVGGDRMNENYHNYAPYYSKYLESFIAHQGSVVLVEVGILKGTGLAIWSDLFSEGRIIGLDIDLSHINHNLENLKTKQGAFKNHNIEFYEFDQFKDNTQVFAGILKGSKINIVIDDGMHFDETIINTLRSAIPYLSHDFVYIIEDNRDVHIKLEKMFPEFSIYCHDELTVLRPH
jgi:hypothetical protein